MITRYSSGHLTPRLLGTFLTVIALLAALVSRCPFGHEIPSCSGRHTADWTERTGPVQVSGAQRVAGRALTTQ